MFRQTILTRALALAFGSAALTFSISQPVMAQSNASGNIFGKIEAATGATINITNLETGFKRQITPGADGRYQITALPPGRYQVQLSRGGAVVETQEIDVLVGQGAEASFAAVQAVKITGRRTKIDVSTSNNGISFTGKELARLAITPTVASIVQLAPNTTRTDTRFAGNAASIGGGAASENATYINGFPATNPLSQLGASELPFGSIGQADIQTGGFGAEFGRSVGGVINLTTKSGTNNWEFGANYSITPNSLRARSQDLYYATTGAAENAATDGTLFRRREDNDVTSMTTGAYIGGPLIKDKLFMFIAAESINTKSSGVRSAVDSTSLARDGFRTDTDETRRYLGKFNFQVTDNNLLELTLIGDTSKNNESRFGYNYATRAVSPIRTFAGNFQNTENNNENVGADINILKYTGNLTNDLTLTALAGKSQSKHKNSFDGSDVGNPNLFSTSASATGQRAGINYPNPQSFAGNVLAPGSKDEVKSFRLDIEYKLGSHTIRAGFDNNKLESTNAGQFSSGGGAFRYLRTATPNVPIALGTERAAVASGGGFGTEGFYVRRDIFTTVTNASSTQSAQYIEDRFQVTKDILLKAGFRRESFDNKNGDGEKFLEQKDQNSPRFAGSWDVNGDSSFKVFGSAGRYSLQIPTGVSVRGASRSTNTSQFFTYTGVDANGAPTGTVPLTGVTSANNEFGQKKDSKTVSTVDLKPTFQDELTLGLEKTLSPDLNVGAKMTYRKLKSTIDDYCDQRPFEAFAAKKGIDTTNFAFLCASFNPGQDNTFLIDFENFNPDLSKRGVTRTLVPLSKEDTGLPEAKRNYFAVDFFAEHPFRNQWFGRVNYTYSKSRGNTEGQVLSDVGQNNVSLTQTWDHKEIMLFSEGLLPNDRTHQIKAFGYYEVTPALTFGANFLLATGRPLNCLGNAPDGIEPGFGYGSSYHFCNGRPSPRGSLGRLPYDIRLDLSAVYKVQQVKGLSLKVEVFNVFNKQTVQSVDEQFNDDSNVSATYMRPLSLTAARNARLTAEYNYKF